MLRRQSSRLLARAPAATASPNITSTTTRLISLAASTATAASPSPPVSPAKTKTKKSKKKTGPVVSVRHKQTREEEHIRLFESAAELEEWLARHTRTPRGLWLKLAKAANKGNGRPCVTYDEALDLALCYGWIDGQRRAGDAHYFLQRFTPRRPGSLWSRRNVALVAALTEQGRMRAPGQAEVDAARADGRWDNAYAGSATIEASPAFEAALAARPGAAEFFAGLSRTKKFPFLLRLQTVKQEKTRTRLIEQFADKLAEGKIP